MRQHPDEEDVWAEILNDVSTASLNKDKKTLVFLGDEGCGEEQTFFDLKTQQFINDPHSPPENFNSQEL